jgi:hypothetical protein
MCTILVFVALAYFPFGYFLGYYSWLMYKNDKYGNTLLYYFLWPMSDLMGSNPLVSIWEDDYQKEYVILIACVWPLKIMCNLFGYVITTILLILVGIIKLTTSPLKWSK